MGRKKHILVVLMAFLVLLPGCELAVDILATGVVIGVIAAVLVIAFIIWAIAKFIDL